MILSETRRGMTLVIGLAAMALLGGCSTEADPEVADSPVDSTATDTDSTATETETDVAANSPGTKTLRVTVLPILDMAPFFYAQEQGIFNELGLDVEAVSSTGGALGIPAMVGGDVDVVFSNTASILLAATEGLPVRVVAGNNANAPDAERDYGAVVVTEDSDIEEAKDLVGRKLAVNTLNNINWAYARTWLRSEGVDPAEVTLLEVPFPQHPPALLEGEVDAVMTVEPFLLGLLDEGARIIGQPYRTHGDITIAHFVTTTEFLEENGEALAAFERGLAEAMQAIEDPANREKLVAALEANTGMTLDVVDRAVFPEFSTKLDKDVLRGMGQVLIDEGLMEEMPDLDVLIHETAQ